jgi:type 1 glutamine amidotransferase
MAVFVISFSLPGCRSGKEDLPLVLVIVGGHSYDTTEFWDMFRSMDAFQFDSVTHPRAMELLASENIHDYDALLFYDFIKDMPLKDSVVYLNLAEEGMPMFFLHHAIGTFQRWDGYLELVGGRWVAEEFTDDSLLWSGYRHDIDLKVQVLDKDHPVTAGINDFDIHDEGYTNVLRAGNIKPLLAVNHPDCDPVVAWENQFVNTKVIYFMMGQDKQAYRNPDFQQFIENGIIWLSKQKGAD